MALQIVFRTDASRDIGTGHVMRCLSLARALARDNVDVLFICRTHDGHLCDLIEEQGFMVYRLPTPTYHFTPGVNPSHAAWLGATWQDDADQTCSIIKGLSVKPAWLVVDHYALDSRWESLLRPLVGHVFVIDDLADRAHDCDLLLDQNLFADLRTRYIGKVPENCHLLLGPEYALLQPTYAEFHDHIFPRSGPIQRIFIFFGGVDYDNLTGRALAAFLNLNRHDIDVDVVIPHNNPDVSEIWDLVARCTNVHLYGNLPTLAPLMASADLAIGAAGTTTWERLCLGLPTLVVTLAENQRELAANLHREKLVWWIGHKDSVDSELIEKALNQIINTPSVFDWSSHCLRTCDGLGVSRVECSLIYPP